MRRGFTLVELLVCVAIVVILAAILFPVFQRYGERKSSCQSNLKQIGLSVQIYVQDNNEHFPSLDTGAGWRKAVDIYVKDDAKFHCPSNGKDQTAKSTDYWFNARLSGIQIAVLEVTSLTVALGDGYSSSDPRVALSELPKSWLADPKSPARRHLDGLNIAFADGHVKWLRPEKITAQTTKNGVLTFAIK